MSGDCQSPRHHPFHSPLDFPALIINQMRGMNLFFRRFERSRHPGRSIALEIVLP